MFLLPATILWEQQPWNEKKKPLKMQTLLASEFSSNVHWGEKKKKKNRYKWTSSRRFDSNSWKSVMRSALAWEQPSRPRVNARAEEREPNKETKLIWVSRAPESCECVTDGQKNGSYPLVHLNLQHTQCTRQRQRLTAIPSNLTMLATDVN